MDPRHQPDGRTADFARTFDQAQWVNGFGIALTPAHGPEETVDPFHIYKWAYGTGPPTQNYARLDAGVRLLFNGVHLAGPDLTPESFRNGLFRQVPSGGGPTTAPSQLDGSGIDGVVSPPP